MPKVVKFTFNALDTAQPVKIETTGFTGNECLTDTADVKKQLGEVTSETKTAEGLTHATGKKQTH